MCLLSNYIALFVQIFRSITHETIQLKEIFNSYLLIYIYITDCKINWNTRWYANKNKTPALIKIINRSLCEILEDEIIEAKQPVNRPLKWSRDSHTPPSLLLGQTSGRKGPIRSIAWSCQSLTPLKLFRQSVGLSVSCAKIAIWETI